MKTSIYALDLRALPRGESEKTPQTLNSEVAAGRVTTSDKLPYRNPPD
jgi:hypothetical protein